MRIVGGSLRGRALVTPRSYAVRPTADRLRESLFNILAHAYDDPVAGARVLELPATGWLRRYRVRAHGSVRADQLADLRDGISIAGVRYGPIQASLDRTQGANVWLTFAMREGKNREVKNVLGHLGLAVNRLIRVSFGPFQLGELAVGAVTEVPTRVLREQLGERVAALAGADFSAPILERVVETNSQGRHPEAPAEGGPRRTKSTDPRPSFETRPSAARRDDGQRSRPNRTRPRPRDTERIGEPERARRERRRGRGPGRGRKD